LAESLFDHLAVGGSIRSWAAHPGRPEKATVLRWALNAGDEFEDKFWAARRLGLLARADDLQDEAKAAVGKDMAGVGAQKLIVDTIKWELSTTSTTSAPIIEGEAVNLTSHSEWHQRLVTSDAASDGEDENGT
jgi:hypothetical protein